MAVTGLIRLAVDHRLASFRGKLYHVVVRCLDLRNCFRKFDDECPAALLDDEDVGFIPNEPLGRGRASRLFVGCRLTRRFWHGHMNSSSFCFVGSGTVTLPRQPIPVAVSSAGGRFLFVR